MSIYVTSDLHLNHYNILKLESANLKNNGLDYIQTIDQYNDMIIQNINSVVKPKDTLYILGDFAFGNYEKVKEVLQRINGYKILIMGNHDKYQPEKAISMGFNQVIQGPYYLPESKGKIIMCHYPVLECKDNPYIACCLHGHLHGSKLCLPNYMNVNIAMNNYEPICLDPILEKIECRAKSRREPWLKEWYASYQIFVDKSRTDINLDEKGQIIL